MIELTINNWQKFNPRPDLKSMKWIRLDTKIIYDPKLHCLKSEQKWLFIALLCLAAEKNDAGKITVDFDYLEYHTQLSVSSIKTALYLMSEKGIIDYTDESDRIRSNPIENVSNVTDGTERTERNVTSSGQVVPNESGKQSISADASDDPGNDPQDVSLASSMQAAIVATNPKAVRARNANLGKWADEFRLMRERDKIPVADIERVMQFVYRNDFWRGIILSPQNLRKKWDTLTAQMSRHKNKSLMQIAEEAERLRKNREETYDTNEIEF